MSKLKICMIVLFITLTLPACWFAKTPEDNGLTAHQISSEALERMSIETQKFVVKQSTDFSDDLMAFIQATDIRRASTYCTDSPIKRDGGTFFRCQINTSNKFQTSEGWLTEITLTVDVYPGIESALRRTSRLIREFRKVFSLPGEIMLDDVLS